MPFGTANNFEESLIAWNLTTHECRTLAVRLPGRVVAVSPDGRRAAVVEPIAQYDRAPSDRRLIVWDLVKRAEMAILAAEDWSGRAVPYFPDAREPAIAFSPDGTTLATAQRDGRIQLRRLESGR